MKKRMLLALTVTAVMAGCSENDLVNDTSGTRKSNEVPIEFNVQKQNITRAANLETVKHYNFGVWAYKVGGKNSLEDAEVMNHYLVGFGGKNVGYDHANATTWAETPGEKMNHISPWFYEVLGTSEYTYNDASTGYYFVNNYESKKPMAWVDYKSKNGNQYLRYWDLAYENTNFYCYAPYNASVTLSHDNTAHTATMTFPAGTTIRDGYDEPRNHAYDAYSRTLGEFMYAGVQAKNADLADVIVPFKHMGAQLFIRFYEDIPGYKVEIIDLDDDKGTLASGVTAGDATKGIQATPAIETTAPEKIASEAEAIEYNKNLTGAVEEGEEKTAAVNYTQEEANEFNATQSGAIHYGDVKTPTVYYTQEDFTNHECNEDQIGQVKSPAVYYTVDEVNQYNANTTHVPTAVSTSTVKTAATTYTAEEAILYNSQLPGALKVGDIKTPGTYNTGQYYTNQGATVTYSTNATPTYVANWTEATKVSTPLMFLIPEAGKTTAADAPANLETFGNHNVIQEQVATGVNQKYSYSPTIYYPVAQPKEGVTATTGTGLTFHISYRIIAEDNKEVVTVHNATVHVPVIGKVVNNTFDNKGQSDDSDDIEDHKVGDNFYITAWQPNVKYTYTFKITRNSTGTTNPSKDIDPTDPKASADKSLYPIVFDCATIDDYNDNYSEYTVSEDTNYGNAASQQNPSNP